jgi:hypothetical protein
MDDRDKVALHEQLARCRELAREFPEGITAQNIREMARELERQLQSMESK